jgi:tryptophan-rich sensory protein
MSSPSIDYRSPRALGITIVFVAAVVLVGAVIGISTAPDDWYAGLAKAPWNPPNWIFGPVWFTLYVLIGIAGARVFMRDPAGPATMIWGLQMVLNWIWSPVWFRLHQPWPAFLLILLILILALAFIWRSARDGDRVSAWLFVPYALWVAFASSLNLAIAVLN